jgi:hypothetical protein
VTKSKRGDTVDVLRRRDMAETIAAAVRNKNAVAYPGAFSRSFPSSYVGLSCRVEILSRDPVK